MDETILKLLVEATKSGYGIPFCLWFLYEKWQEKQEAKEIKAKKASGDYVSFEDVKELKEIVKAHLIKEAQEDIVMANVQSELKHHQEKFEDLKEIFNKYEENQKDAFKLISQIKDHLIK